MPTRFGWFYVRVHVTVPGPYLWLLPRHQHRHRAWLGGWLAVVSSPGAAGAHSHHCAAFSTDSDFIVLRWLCFALISIWFGSIWFGLVWFGLTVANGSVGFATFWLMQLAWKKTFTSTYLGNCVCVCLLVSAEKYLPYTLALAKRSQRWKSSWRTLAAMQWLWVRPTNHKSPRHYMIAM